MESTSQLSRRRWLQNALCLSSASLLAGSVAPRLEAATAKPKHLVRPQDLDSLETRAKIVTQLDGKLHLKPNKPDRDSKPREAEIKAESTLDYFEKLAFKESQYVASERRYVEAKSENWIEGKRTKQQLRPECRKTRQMRYEGNWQQYCQEETLDLRESQLLQSPINSGCLELLLPTKPATATSSWEYTQDDLERLFNLDAVHTNSVQAKVGKVEKGIATIELAGEIEATANSVPTKLVIKGNFRAQLGSSCALVTWVAISVKEIREIGESEPGFDITALVRMIRMETDSKISTAAEALRKSVEDDDTGRWLVQIKSDSGAFIMLGDRRWRTFADSREETILRFIENNTVVAQCNISRLTNVKPGTQVTLEGMQTDIKRSLGEKFEEFLEAQERVTSSQLRLMRSVASGTVENVPVQWIYNHLSNDNGERIAVIVTLGSNRAEDFAGNDVQLTSSLRMLDLKPPTSASESGEQRSASNSGGQAKTPIK